MTPSIVVMCMGGVGHMQALVPVVEGFRRRGCRVRVMTALEFRKKVEATGAEFSDVYASRPLEAADATSMPYPTRYVTFAAVYAEALAREVAAWKPDLIVYETFTVAAPVVAQMLRVPYVNVCTGHATVPARTVAALWKDPRVALSAECLRAVERLKKEHGLQDASPFFYVQALSPHLNLYCEPAEFLVPGDRTAFQPIEFFGSLSSSALDAAAPLRRRAAAGPLRVYVSFGTAVLRYFEPAAIEAWSRISRTLASSDVDLVVSLGGQRLTASASEALARADVEVVEFVDQWAVLRDADIFVTHHGQNSTHEAIFRETPMISYPFFGDQPALARRCQDLGLAVALGDVPQAPIEPGALRAAIDRVLDDRSGFSQRLAEARSWEVRTIAGRDAVLDRMLALGNG